MLCYQPGSRYLLVLLLLLLGEPATEAYVTEGSLVEGVLDGELGRVVATLRGSLASAAGNSVEDRLT